MQIETNLYGPKRMVEAFLPLLNPTDGTPPVYFVRVKGRSVPGVCRWTIGLYRERLDGLLVCTGANVYGPKRMAEAFLPLLNPTEGKSTRSRFVLGAFRWTIDSYRERLNGRSV